MLIAIEGVDGAGKRTLSRACNRPSSPQKVGCHPHFPALRAVGDCRRRR
ncbi:hypothetical protein I552_9209 [Mycobacterium xenopi 3993]|nr:hypothetical protein I552_9209 [Mycobacterium xenopi 3993]